MSHVDGSNWQPRGRSLAISPPSPSHEHVPFLSLEGVQPHEKRVTAQTVPASRSSVDELLVEEEELRSSVVLVEDEELRSSVVLVEEEELRSSVVLVEDEELRSSVLVEELDAARSTSQLWAQLVNVKVLDAFIVVQTT
jgi:hypothetical protein